MKLGRRFYIAATLYVIATTGILVFSGLDLAGTGSTFYTIALILLLPLALIFGLWGNLLFVAVFIANGIAGWLVWPVGIVGFAGVAAANALVVRLTPPIVREMWRTVREMINTRT